MKSLPCPSPFRSASRTFSISGTRPSRSLTPAMLPKRTCSRSLLSRSTSLRAPRDGPGLLAAEQLKRRAREAGIAVHIVLPSRHRGDCADVLAGLHTLQPPTLTGL